MTEIPGMIVWTDAYLADTQHLSTFEHGAYFLILMAMWRNGGKLPKCSKRLALLAKTSPFHWGRIEQNIMEFMMIEDHPDGSRWITQKRLHQELDLAQARNSKRVSSGRLGGLAKALKYNGVASSNASSALIAKSKQGSTTSIPIPIKEKSLSYELGQKRGDGSVAARKNLVCVIVGTPQWNAWETYYRSSNGKSPPRSSKHHPDGAWYFPTEWPPGHRPTKS